MAGFCRNKPPGNTSGLFGAVADDDVYRTLALYMTGILDREETLKRIKIKKLFSQLVFATEK